MAPELARCDAGASDPVLINTKVVPTISGSARKRRRQRTSLMNGYGRVLRLNARPSAAVMPSNSWWWTARPQRDLRLAARPKARVSMAAAGVEEGPRANWRSRSTISECNVYKKTASAAPCGTNAGVM
jgi:hypothetical protein